MKKILIFHHKAGTQRDKTLADKSMYIPNDDTQNYPFCTLKLVVETYELNKSKFTYQSCLTNEYENVIRKLLGLV